MKKDPKKKKALRRAFIVFSRLAYTLFFITVQTAALILMYLFALDKLPYFLLVCTVISLLCAAHLINRNDNPAYTVAWLVPMLLLPIFGGLLYLMFGSRRVTKRQRALSAQLRRYAEKDTEGPVRDAADPSSPDAPGGKHSALQSAYLRNVSGCSPYADTDTVYYSCGEAMLPALLQSLRRAEHYIFITSFIIAEGEFWDSILPILTEKAAGGVDVRVMYDDFGCILTLPRRYDGFLRANGIKSQVYNRFNTVLSSRPNNRDHRKICIVDGTEGFCGGVNIADEYINRKMRFGYWKDAAIFLRGSAVRGMTAQYLAVWDFCSGEKEMPENFMPKKSTPADGGTENGIVQPFTDVPLDCEHIGETVYFQLIARAERYIYLTTPYLVIDHAMITALCGAAKSGVDVRIMTPHIPDKKTVYFLTRSYYRPLLEAGVRIFEFTPGFLHAKTAVADDRFAVVGSVNLDYRSLYLNMESAVWMCGSSAVRDIKADFLRTQEESGEVLREDLGRLTWYKRLWLSVLRTFAPLF